MDQKTGVQLQQQIQQQLLKEGTVIFKAKIGAGSSRSSIVGALGENGPGQQALLKIKIAAPPEKGKANAAVIKLLSKTFGVPAKNIEILSGQTSPLKIIKITTHN